MSEQLGRHYVDTGTGSSDSPGENPVFDRLTKHFQQELAGLRTTCEDQQHPEQLIMPDVSPEQIRAYETVAQRSQSGLFLVEMLLYEIQSNHNLVELLEPHTITIDPLVDIRGLSTGGSVSLYRALQTIQSYLQVYAQGQFVMIDEDGDGSMRISLKDSEQLLDSVDSMGMLISNVIGELLDAITRHNNALEQSLTEPLEAQMPDSRVIDQATIDRIRSLGTGVGAILETGDESGDPRSDLLRTIQQLHEDREKQDAVYAQQIADRVTMDVLGNEQLFYEEAFNTQQPVLRFANVDDREEVTPPGGDPSIVSCAVSKIPIRSETTREMKRINNEKSTEYQPPSYTAGFGGYEYYFKLEFQDGTSGYYQKCQLTKTTDDGEETHTFYRRLGVDVGSEEDNQEYAGVPRIVLGSINDDTDVQDALDGAEDTIDSEESMDTGTGIPLGSFAQTTLQQVMADPTIGIDQLENFIDNPYAEGGIINMIRDQVQHHRDKLGGDLTLESDKGRFIVSRMIQEMKRLYNDMGQGPLLSYKRRIESLDNSETRESVEEGLVLAQLMQKVQKHNSSLEQQSSGGDAIAQRAAPHPGWIHLDAMMEDDTQAGKVQRLIEQKISGNLMVPPDPESDDDESSEQDEPRQLTPFEHITRMLLEIDIADDEVNGHLSEQKKQIEHHAKLAFCQSVLNGLFEGTSEDVTGNHHSQTFEGVSSFGDHALVHEYPALDIYADAMGIGAGNWSDDNIAYGIAQGKELVLQVALTAMAGGLGAVVARRGLMLLAKGAMKLSRSPQLIQKFYYCYKYAHTGLRFGGTGFRMLAGGLELGVNSSVFHLSHGFLHGVVAGDLSHSMQQTLTVSGFAKSFVTLGVLRKVGQGMRSL